MKRLNKIAKRITAYDETIEQFIKECEDSDKFNWKQIDEIRGGFDDGLTIEQVKLYAKSDFDYEQMFTIRYGFKNGLTIEQIKFYANPEFNSDQMWEIRRDFVNGLTIEEVKEKYSL